MKNDSPSPASVQMLLAFKRLNKPLYEGTVPEHVKAKRRARNRRARVSRRANRNG